MCKRDRRVIPLLLAIAIAIAICKGRTLVRPGHVFLVPYGEEDTGVSVFLGAESVSEIGKSMVASRDG